MLGVVDAEVGRQGNGILLVGDIADGEFGKGTLECVLAASLA
jgi:hypothetical protein